MQKQKVAKTTAKQWRVTLVKSLNKKLAAHKSCARGLGLTKLNSSRVVADTDCHRGMIGKIHYLLKVEEL